MRSDGTQRLARPILQAAVRGDMHDQVHALARCGQRTRICQVSLDHSHREIRRNASVTRGPNQHPSP